MEMDLIRKYAHLLINYCLCIKAGDKLYVTSTTLAEPLLREIYAEATKAGAHTEINMVFEGMNKAFYDNASNDQLEAVSPFTEHVMRNFDAYLVIRAPFNNDEDKNIDGTKSKIRTKAMAGINSLYFQRTANGEMRRSLCQYPTQAAADEAGMTLDEYGTFVFSACKLYADDPQAEWLKIRSSQQHIVDYLNTIDELRYKNEKTDISCSVKDRIWINSDGRSNMPSGEVFTGPIENSVNGTIYFDFPSIYSGEEAKGITLEVKDGQVIKWHAEQGQKLLDRIMEIEGARYFGEIAIGTNYDITVPTKNILFDEKIGGTVHMAIGQSYLQTGGKNQSAVHWDMIADMSKNGYIFADGVKIYENGKFLI